MYKNKKILGVITARGGSKGIPQKNIKLLAGKPLILYTIEAAKKSNFLSRCIVSTDYQEIAMIAKAAGADVPFLRPGGISKDDSTSVEVVQHALKWLKEEAVEEYDYVMILQPTSPLRTSEDIDNCIRKVVDTDADSIMSMVELVDFSPKKLKKIKDDVIVPFLEEEVGISAQRQTGETIYKRNCAIYLTRVEIIMKGDMFGKISRPYIMPRERSVDINEPSDFELAEFWLKKLNLI